MSSNLVNQSIILKYFICKGLFTKGDPPSEDLGYGEEDIISHSTLIVDVIKGNWRYILYISPLMYPRR